MTDSSSLLDWILNLLRDPETRAVFEADPNGYAADHGFPELAPRDVYDALCLIADNRSAGYDHRGGGADGGGAGVHYPPPPHPDSGDDAPRYLRSYLTNNYTSIDDRDTRIDNSVHQRIDTDGGDFHQSMDNDPVAASGDGAVAAGGEIRDSTLTTGDANVVGDGNQAVTGDDNTTAFGSGDAVDASFGDARFGDGSAVSVGGDASGTNADNDTTTSVRGSGSGDTSVNAAGDHGTASQTADQHESDSGTHSSYQDESRTDSHDDLGSHSSSQVEDSHDYESLSS
jgi:hypothetical protein